MLIILGIVVLTVSFVIALISLIVEEHKREKLIAEHEGKTASRDVLPEEPQSWYEEKVPENVQAEEEIHQSSLSGEIKIGDISKKQQ